MSTIDAVTEVPSTALTFAQATQRFAVGAKREKRRGNAQVSDLCADAIALRGHDVKALAAAADKAGKLEGSPATYRTYLSKAGSIAALFSDVHADIDRFLATTDLVGLTAVYNAFSELFDTTVVPDDEGAEGSDDDTSDDDTSAPTTDADRWDAILNILTGMDDADAADKVAKLVAKVR